MKYVLCVILALCLGSCSEAQISGTNTPEVLQDQLEAHELKYILAFSEAQDIYLNHNKTFTVAEWEELVGYLSYINIRGQAAGIAIKLCDSLSQGSYCDEAASDMKLMAEQYKKLEKFDERIESVERDPESPGQIN